MDLSLIPLIVGNVVCSIGVIFVNKYLFTRLAFAYSATLTGFHFIATTMFSFALVHTGVENAGELEGRRVWVLALITSYSIWAQNLSLLVNTVSIYQVAKLFVIPTTVLLQLLIFRKRVALSTLISLIVVTVGVGLTTVEEIRGSSTGVLVALNGAVSTALQQLLYNVIMNDRKLSGVQLYYHIGPLCAGLMTFGGLLMDRFMSKSQEWIYEADIPGSTWVRRPAPLRACPHYY